MAGVVYETGTAYFSRASVYIPVFDGVRVVQKCILLTHMIIYQRSFSCLGTEIQ